MQDLGRVLVVAGVALAAVGLVLYLAPSVPLLGRLPGDVRIERPGFRFYFPLTTCLLLSAVATAVMYLIGRWR